MSDMEKLLRRDAREPVPDSGFTARVMGALPARAARERLWFKPLLIVGSAGLGSILAAALAPGRGSLLQGFADLVGFRGFTPAAVTGLAMCAALLVSAIVLAAEAD
ncbi:MAG: hypothetical protein ACXWHC_13270 [Usitatibacter sp.]